MRHGIWDYLLKPVNIPRLRSLLARIPRPYELTEEVQTLRATLRELGHFGAMLGRSGAIQHVYDLIEQTAPTEAAVLICGEPGTGKKIAARTLHEMSRRRKGPFVAFDCRAAGKNRQRTVRSTACCSATNAVRSRAAENREPGLLEQAGGGTLFLEQIDALPNAQQEALLARARLADLHARRRQQPDHDRLPPDRRDPHAVREGGHRWRLREDLRCG